MSEVKSLCLFVGTRRCNANCSHCAGKPLRKYAPFNDGEIDLKLMEKTIRDCYAKGARRLSISSSGEPTCSPISLTMLLTLIQKLKYERIEFFPINLYSNGIKIGKDVEFADTFLPIWKKLGLTHVYITVHNINEKRNAQIYGVNEYPSLLGIVDRLHKYDLRIRANIVLSKGNIDTFIKFRDMVNELFIMGVDYISAWPIRNVWKDEIDKELMPDETELNRMKAWAFLYHQDRLRVLGEENKEEYNKGNKLTLFPNGNLSNSWCN